MHQLAVRTAAVCSCIAVLALIAPFVFSGGGDSALALMLIGWTTVLPLSLFVMIASAGTASVIALRQAPASRGTRLTVSLRWVAVLLVVSAIFAFATPSFPPPVRGILLVSTLLPLLLATCAVAAVSAARPRGEDADDASERSHGASVRRRAIPVIAGVLAAAAAIALVVQSSRVQQYHSYAATIDSSGQDEATDRVAEAQYLATACLSLPDAFDHLDRFDALLGERAVGIFPAADLETALRVSAEARANLSAIDTAPCEAEAEALTEALSLAGHNVSEYDWWGAFPAFEAYQDAGLPQQPYERNDPGFFEVTGALVAEAAELADTANDRRQEAMAAKHAAYEFFDTVHDAFFVVYEGPGLDLAAAARAAEAHVIAVSGAAGTPEAQRVSELATALEGSGSGSVFEHLEAFVAAARVLLDGGEAR